MTALIIGQTDNELRCWAFCNFYLTKPLFWFSLCRVQFYSLWIFTLCLSLCVRSVFWLFFRSLSSVLIQWRLQRMENMHTRNIQPNECERVGFTAERESCVHVVVSCRAWISCAIVYCYQHKAAKNFIANMRNRHKHWRQLQLM